jgi:hypothetical protein
VTTYTSAWLIAAYHDFPSTSFTVNAAPTGNEVKTVAAGDYYLYDATAGNALNEQVELQLEDHTDITTATVELLESGKIKITCDTTFAITWGSGTLVRNLLGYTGDLSGATNYTATYVSPLFWSPAGTESPQLSVLGGTGAEESDIAYGLSPTTYGIATEHNTRQINTFLWRNVASARFYSASEANGEFYTWWTYAKKLANFKLYRSIAEDTAGTGAASLGTPLGPYKLDPRKLPRGNPFPFGRSSGFTLVDQFHPVSLDVVTTVELDNS